MLPIVTAALAIACSLAFARVEDPKPAPIAAPKPALVPGTRVKLAAPAGHEPGRGFLGYTWPETGATLSLIELGGPYAEVVTGLEAKGLERGGMTLIESADVKLCGRDGRLVFVSQSAQGIEFRKWLGVCGDEKRVLMLVVAFPKELEEPLAAQFKSVLLGATWDQTIEVDPFTVLPWTTAPPAGLRFAGNMGTSLFYSEDGELVQKDKPASARLMISPSMGETRVGDLRAFTEKRARELPYVGKRLEIESSTAFEVLGRNGWELVGKSKHEKNGLELFVHVVILAGEDDYMIFYSQVANEKRNEWLPRFRACAQSWKPKVTPGPESK